MRNEYEAECFRKRVCVLSYPTGKIQVKKNFSSDPVGVSVAAGGYCVMMTGPVSPQQLLDFS